MLEETRLENIALTALQNAVNALIETQTILQLLVKKGIVTVEEVKNTREIVKRQPKYKGFLQSIEEALNDASEIAKFEELFQKMLNDKESLTEEERNYLLHELDKVSND